MYPKKYDEAIFWEKYPSLEKNIRVVQPRPLIVALIKKSLWSLSLGEKAPRTPPPPLAKVRLCHIYSISRGMCLFVVAATYKDKL